MNPLADDLKGMLSDPRHMTDQQLMADAERVYDSPETPDELRRIAAAMLTLHYRHAKFWNEHYQRRYAEGKDPNPPKLTPVRDFGMSEDEAQDILKNAREELFPRPGYRGQPGQDYPRDSEPTDTRQEK